MTSNLAAESRLSRSLSLSLSHTHTHFLSSALYPHLFSPPSLLLLLSVVPSNIRAPVVICPSRQEGGRDGSRGAKPACTAHRRASPRQIYPQSRSLSYPFTATRPCSEQGGLRATHKSCALCPCSDPLHCRFTTPWLLSTEKTGLAHCQHRIFQLKGQSIYCSLLPPMLQACCGPSRRAQFFATLPPFVRPGCDERPPAPPGRVRIMLLCSYDSLPASARPPLSSSGAPLTASALLESREPGLRTRCKEGGGAVSFRELTTKAP